MNKIARLSDFQDAPAMSHMRPITWLPVGQLCVRWVQSQRPLRGPWAEELAETFDPDLLGLIAVSQPNKAGMYHVIDGAHRRYAVAKLFGDDERVPCNVLDASDPVRAAQIFDRLNSQRKPVAALEKFKVRVTGKNPDHVAVNAVVEAAGFRVENSPNTDGCIRATESLMHVYRQHGEELLSLTLETIKKIWGYDADAMAGPIIRGIAGILDEHRAIIDIDRLVDRVSKAFTPGRLIGAAKSLRELQHGSAGNAIRMVIVATYNKGLRGSGKLPS